MACVGASGCVVCRRSLVASCLGGLARLPVRLRLHVPGPRSVISWTFLSRARPSLRLPLLQGILQRRFRSTAGAATLCLLSSLRPDAGGPSSISPGPSVCPTDPSLAGTPRSGASYVSFLACPHHESHRERKAFLTALTRFLAMIGSLPHRSHAHRQLSIPFTLQQAGYIS